MAARPVTDRPGEGRRRGDGPRCPFCDIVRGAAFGRIVHEDADSVAFLPLRPATDGHVLVVPRRHLRDLWDLDDTTAAALSRSVLTVARAVRAAFRPDGLNLVNSAGAAATQTVMHLHVHVVPRFEGDRVGSFWPRSGSPGRPEAAPSPREWEPGVLDRTAERIRRAAPGGVRDAHG
ncbi:HIT family protein [Streptomyces sp. NPDC008313]|uniref:HIT family protein n=1 Tax=Streptomyces sp. NPDC008313 TaxID=3364826 RepID=UPI0036E51410